MTPKEIAHKYVHGNHDALTDNQEKLYMVADIEEYAKQKDERIKELEEVMKTTLADSDCVNNVTNLSVFNRQVIENCLN